MQLDDDGIHVLILDGKVIKYGMIRNLNNTMSIEGLSHIVFLILICSFCLKWTIRFLRINRLPTYVGIKPALILSAITLISYIFDGTNKILTIVTSRGG